MKRENLDSIAIARCLRRCSTFSSYPRAELDAIVALSERRSFKKGSRLCRQGEPCASVFVLVRGIIKLTRGLGSHTEKVMQILYPAVSFGESALFASHSYPVTAIALANVEVLVIDAAEFSHFLEVRPARMADMLRELGGRLEHWMCQVERLGSFNAAQKVASYLLERRRRRHKPRGCRSDTLPAEPRMEMASLLAIRPETLSRTIRDFRQQNLIGIEHGEIVVTNSHRLAAIANEADA